MVNESEKYRIRLRNYGIVFNESVYQENTEIQLPSDVDALRKKLLDFEHIVPPKSIVGLSLTVTPLKLTSTRRATKFTQYS